MYYICGIYDNDNVCEGANYSFFVQLFEANIEFEIRFMVDKGVVGCNWIELPAGKYSVRSSDLDTSDPGHVVNGDVHIRSNTSNGETSTVQSANGAVQYTNGAVQCANNGFTIIGGGGASENRLRPQTKCQLEVDVSYEDLISHPAEGEWQKIAPLRILSFDIECAARKGVFPDASQDRVIQIANMVVCQSEKEPFIKNVFTLDTDVCIYNYTCTYVHVHVCTIYIHVDVHVNHMYMYMHVYIYICMCIYTVYTYNVLCSRLESNICMMMYMYMYVRIQ